MNSKELIDEVNKVKVKALTALSDFIKEHIKNSLNVLPYAVEGYCSIINIYGCDKNGYGISYLLNSIKIKNDKPIFILSDNDEYYEEQRYIDDFEVDDLIWILEVLEDIFESIKKYNVPYLEEGEEFDNEEE